MKHKIKIILVNLTCGLLYYVGIIGLYRFLFAQKTIGILFFHQVDARRFEKCIAYLKKHYKIISLDDFINIYKSREPLPHNAVVLTFDDGYKSNYVENYPVLKKYDVPSIGFLTANLIGTDKILWWDQIIYAVNHTNQSYLPLDGKELPLKTQLEKDRAIAHIFSLVKKMPDQQKNDAVENITSQLKIDLKAARSFNPLMSWDQAREMNANGVAFGAHTLNHPILTRIPLDEAENQIRQSGKIVEQQLAKPVKYFCYPNGEIDDFNEDIKKLVKDAGYQCALTTVAGRTDLNSDLFALNRIPFTEHVNLPVFAVTVSGFFGNLPIWY